MESVKKSIFIIGFNDKDTHKQIFTDQKCMEIITNCVAEFYDGATFSNCCGMYKGEMEKSVKIEILWSSEQKDILFMDLVKKAMNQESIYYETVMINGGYF